MKFGCRAFSAAGPMIWNSFPDSFYEHRHPKPALNTHALLNPAFERHQCLSVCLSVCPSVHLNICLSVAITWYISVRLRMCAVRLLNDRRVTCSGRITGGGREGLALPKDLSSHKLCWYIIRTLHAYRLGHSCMMLFIRYWWKHTVC